MTHLALFLAFLPAAVAILGDGGVHYLVTNDATNTRGGARFNHVISHHHTIQILEKASAFIWTTFRQHSNNRKPIHHVFMTVDNYEGAAYTADNKIHISEGYIAQFTGDLKSEIEGVLFHEMTHIWQWSANGAANGGLIEGIADFIRLRAGLGPTHWVKPGEGDKWDQGYDVTARFLDYCDEIGGRKFVANLNRRMKSEYTDGFFKELLGKTVDELWKEYKAKHGH